ncbi:replication protein A 32 kDa subunit A-like isoform X2 [Olea europaea var. sylvestris]|uniref:Replication A 32 kDa subunit A-like n=1 Tax=Olea europaea subsp. europaea TaxID=158383 RepID=A0A8S0PR15_OLEEU|nr:replication protein A 32 kDa subunit A-like isoform X2 [Olea europaea var. sylvestris]CAA2955984.1 replication A 32 kDa subunit A-like [Olea europaea subsp. europaea]
MFSSSQFESAPAFTGGGGGFNYSQSTQSADPVPTSAKSRDTQPMVPVTAKQIIEASQSTDDKSNFLVDGAIVSNVKLVGMAFDKAERVTDVSFVIDDGTGRIGCNRWVNEAVDRKEVEGLSDGTYVRIHGHLKSFHGNKQVVVFAIRPVTDYNEIANHFLECIYAHSCNARLQTGVLTPASSSSTLSTPSNGNQKATSNQFSQEYNLDGLNNIDKLVIEYLERPSSTVQEKGVHRDEIATQLKVPMAKILEAIESLESEGLIYSTIDEYHYKSTSTG